jgi:choline dehydrogenase-like flavoprotein
VLGRSDRLDIDPSDRYRRPARACHHRPMIVDLANADLRELPPYDVAIIGSGPAGGTVAAELADSGLRVCVLESGRMRRTKHADALKEVVSTGLPIKEYSRERVLGGASTTWAGLSAPLDPIDMVERPWLDAPGWPIDRSELEPFWEQAAERFQFPTANDFGPEGFGALRDRGRATPRFDGLEEKVFMACDEPQRFGKLLRPLYESEAVDLYLDASVTALVGDGERGRIASARVRTSSGRDLRVTARHFVIGCGGLENARLLLLSRDLCQEGLGNEHDQVGRYLMNHPKNYHGELELTEPVTSWPYLFGCLYSGFAGYAGLRLTEERQRELSILNSYVRFEPLFPWSGDTGVESAVLLAKRSVIALKALKAKQSAGQVVELRDYSETGDDTDLQNARKSVLDWVGVGWNVVANAPSVTKYAYHRLSKVAPKVRRVRLRNFMEMEPDASNRVTLDDRVDVLGSALPHVRHETTELDRRSLVELHRALAPAFEAEGLGRLVSDLEGQPEWPITQDASHHLGTTRMGVDPRHSVTDSEGRLHSVPNVTMAGGSLFPTSGCANPTFTIVALSIRIAQRLRRDLEVREEVPRT